MVVSNIENQSEKTRKIGRDKVKMLEQTKKRGDNFLRKALVWSVVIAVIAAIGYYYGPGKSSAGPVKVEPEHELMELTAVLYSEDKPSLVIGSKIMHEDETIDDVTVVKINPGEVEFEKNGVRWKQKLGSR